MHQLQPARMLAQGDVLLAAAATAEQMVIAGATRAGRAGVGRAASAPARSSTRRSSASAA